jgi:ferredoxin
MRIDIDRDRCVGSGNCLFWAPATFDLDDGGTSIVIDPDGDDPDTVRVAAEGCPTRAITVRSDPESPAPADSHRHEGGGDADRPVR